MQNKEDRAEKKKDKGTRGSAGRDKKKEKPEPEEKTGAAKKSDKGPLEDPSLPQGKPEIPPPSFGREKGEGEKGGEERVHPKGGVPRREGVLVEISQKKTRLKEPLLKSNTAKGETGNGGKKKEPAKGVDDRSRK